MQRLLFIVISLGTLIISCGPSSRNIFVKRSAHEKYGDGLKDAGLSQSSLGTAWFNAAVKSLDQPLSITLPYKEAGYFAADKPSAAGYRFNLRRGEIVNVQLTTIPVTGHLLFVELWSNEKSLLESADTITKKLQHEAEKDGSYILRVQPELLQSVEYTITISTAASLAFPVRESDKPRITSFWGADRDGGVRSHEGIDILAPFRTPIVASANGRVTRVNENNLGGKVVFMRPEGKNYSLYYAHLDSQLVSSGQTVRAGDIIGLMGNTGNARTTAPHLHFGIYTADGAVDPLPFVDKNRPAPKKITADTSRINNYARLQNGQIIRITGAADASYKILYPDGKESMVKSTDVSIKPLRNEKLTNPTRLLDEPNILAAAKTLIPANSEVTLLGTHQGLYYVKYKDITGWLQPPLSP